MALDTEQGSLTIVMIGNPNTGKSTLFHSLSGVTQHIANYAGVTVEPKLGSLAHGGRSWTLIDLPGMYSLAPRSPDEIVAVDALLGRNPDLPRPDVLLCVISAVNLDRDLYLASQVLEMGLPTVVALTMRDIADGRNIRVDAGRLAERLGVPVVPVRAPRRVGLDDLKTALEEAGNREPGPRASLLPEPFQREVAALEAFLAPRLTAGSGPLPRALLGRLLLDRGGYAETRLPLGGCREEFHAWLAEARNRLEDAGCKVPDVETTSRRAWVAEVVDEAVHHAEGEKASFGDRLDHVLTHKVWGSLILALVLMLIFSAVFTWAQVPMDWIDARISDLAGLVHSHMAEGALRSLLADGMIRGIGSVIVFLPQIMLLFGFLSVLEESGYLGRAAFLMDRLMVKVGLSGKSFIPMLSSFACAIPGVMAARTIENRRDRLTTILIAPLMSCSARLPVYTLMIAAFIPNRQYLGGLLSLPGLTMLAMYLTGVAAAAVVAFLLRRTMLKGEPPPLVLELPAYKWPSPRVVIQRVLDRSWDFLHAAGTVIFAVSILMWAALYYPRVPARKSPRWPPSGTASKPASTKPSNQATRPPSRGKTELAAARGRLDGYQKRQAGWAARRPWIEPTVRPEMGTGGSPAACPRSRHGK
ncbi:MAG: ferrous iron transport protein B [Isosphaeraceae bacterium]